MKKLLYFLLVLIICTSLIGCEESPIDIWDGTTAKEFEDGDGTKNSPFVIKTSSQFAYMAKCVNEGKYNDSYFVLEKDLDLKGIKWTPIGNRDNPFRGTFDGKEHTVSGLFVDKGYYYTETFHLDERTETQELAFAGMFGYCSSVDIHNLNIKDAKVNSKTAGKGNILSAGVLIGEIREERDSKEISNISNVKVSGSEIFIEYDESSDGMAALGGIVGKSLFGSIKMECVQSEIVIDTSKAGWINNNYVGGIMGWVGDTALECKNIANYSTILFSDNVTNNYAGAFGEIRSIDKAPLLENIFSKVVTTNRYIDISYASFKTNSIAGNLQYNGEPLEFKNLYGCVLPYDENSGFTEPRYELYSFFMASKYPEAVYTEINCKGCDKLPDDHGLDSEIWDLSDKEHPVLK
ncbi:MAG: hypothetical protein E7613_06730 [Ruminococcaceae bacterium]|nr:hypothetical protein [Oscillospiraceae bacterium]